MHSVTLCQMIYLNICKILTAIKPKKILVLPVTGFKKKGSVGREKFFFVKYFFHSVEFRAFKSVKVCNFAMLYQNQDEMTWKCCMKYSDSDRQNQITIRFK